MSRRRRQDAAHLFGGFDLEWLPLMVAARTWRRARTHRRHNFSTSWIVFPLRIAPHSVEDVVESLCLPKMPPIAGARKDMGKGSAGGHRPRRSLANSRGGAAAADGQRRQSPPRCAISRRSASSPRPARVEGQPLSSGAWAPILEGTVDHKPVAPFREWLRKKIRERMQERFEARREGDE
jgi:hypothetical protein